MWAKTGTVKGPDVALLPVTAFDYWNANDCIMYRSKWPVSFLATAVWNSYLLIYNNLPFSNKTAKFRNHSWIAFVVWHGTLISWALGPHLLGAVLMRPYLMYNDGSAAGIWPHYSQGAKVSKQISHNIKISDKCSEKQWWCHQYVCI